jgi:hypothetical protein
MTWEPITREDLLADIAVAVDAAPDGVRAAWQRIRIEPEKWRCSPWGDQGGGFWVVALSGDSVIWFNDIEGGFNRSRFQTRGVIDDYLCNQTDFDEFLRTFPEAVEAEAYAAARPAQEVPEALRGPGSIVERRTTYWELRADSGAGVRVHFSDKQEHRLRAPVYPDLQLCARHPVLIDYEEPWAEVYVSGAERCDPALGDELAAYVDRSTGGWRHARAYLAGPATQLLAAGSGLLLRAPESIAVGALDLARKHGATASILEERAARAGYRALVLGQSFIIARAFRFE